MNEERDRAIENVLRIAYAQTPTLSADDFPALARLVFDAGVAHERKRWNVVETDGLPTERGVYLTQRTLPDEFDISTMTFYPDMQMFANHNDQIIAWRELPEPYSKDGGQRDD